MPTEERIERLMRLAASLEEAIIRIEGRQSEQDIQQTVIRLRVMQGEILTALQRLEGDFRPDV